MVEQGKDLKIEYISSYDLLDTEPIVLAAAVTTNEHVQLPGPHSEIRDNSEEEQTVSLIIKRGLL